MDLKEYAKMVEITDNVRMDIGDVNAQTILDTIAQTYAQIEDFCNDMIPNFKKVGKIIQELDTKDDTITQEIDIFINNVPIEKTEYSGYIDDINKILTDNFSYIGWEEQ